MTAATQEDHSHSRSGGCVHVEEAHCSKFTHPADIPWVTQPPTATIRAGWHIPANPVQREHCTSCTGLDSVGKGTSLSCTRGQGVPEDFTRLELSPRGCRNKGCESDTYSVLLGSYYQAQESSPQRAALSPANATQSETICQPATICS